MASSDAAEPSTPVAPAALPDTSPADCPGCEANRIEGWGPNHKPSSYCESGKRPHCTCDMCF